MAFADTFLGQHPITMTLDVSLILELAVLGLCTGFLAGLLGIGGGMVTGILFTIVAGVILGLVVHLVSVLALPRIVINGGRKGYLVGLAPQVLVQLLGKKHLHLSPMVVLNSRLLVRQYRVM